MTDWVAIASAAVGILVPYVKKAGEKVAEKAGEAIFNLIKDKLTNNEEAESTLKNFEKNPERHGAALADILREKAESDPGFGIALQKLIEAASEQERTSIQQQAIGKGIAQAAGSGASASVSISKEDD